MFANRAYSSSLLAPPDRARACSTSRRQYLLLGSCMALLTLPGSMPRRSKAMQRAAQARHKSIRPLVGPRSARYGLSFVSPGRRTVNTEPFPGSLATVTSPPIMRASLRERARPSPVPPKR
jgi:hypothetical protein